MEKTQETETVKVEGMARAQATAPEAGEETE